MKNGAPTWALKLVCIVGWLAAVIVPQARAQFAQHVLSPGTLQANSTPPAAALLPGAAAMQPGAIQPGVKLPSCPFTRILSTQGVPEEWSSMPMKQQVTHPINAIMVQLAYAVWQDDPAATLGKCLDNLGIDRESIYVTHRVVLPYLGTMTSLVMRSDKGVFVSFRGTNFDDPGDVLVDADCQHTVPLGRLFGTNSSSLRLHTGFFRAWDTLGSYVLAAVKKQLPKTETGKVYLIGHSLGAAMATVAALRMDTLFANTDYEVGGVWLFGCPRVGNEAWSREYNARLLDRTLRFVNFADFASRLPMPEQFCTTLRLGATFEFRHVGQSVLLCPDAETGLVDWRLGLRGSETLDCGGPRPDTPDITVTTHWLGSYLDAWRRGLAAALDADEELGEDPHILSVMCDECSLSFPDDRAKQMNVPARAGGPLGCSSTASCGLQTAWDAAAAVGGEYSRKFNPASVCVGYVCT